MSVRKVQLNLVNNKYLKLFVRCANQGGGKKNVACDQSLKKCTEHDIETEAVIKEDKDICVYSTCPKEPCPIEPCQADLPSSDPDKPEEPTIHDVSIVIVGAGVAGLSCAQRLIKAGFRKTLVLEAEYRPGGRIQSGWLNDTVIERGSDWCCETCSPFKNNIVQMGVKKGLFSIPLSGVDPSQGLLVQSDCTPFPLPIVCMAFTHLSDILQEFQCLRSQVPRTQADLAESYIAIRVHQLLKKLPVDLAMICARLLLGLTSYITPGQRKIVSDTFGAYATNANMRIPLGYVGALAPLISDITPERILYSKQVLNVRWGTVISDQHPRAVLKCRDGSTYAADYVVITCPLGVLKRNIGTMFCPALSSLKTKAINEVSIGHKGKIFLEYDQPFWVWRDEKIQKKWNDGDLSKRDNFTRGMVGLEELPGSEHVLVATIIGSSVEDMEKLTEKEVANYLTGFLREWTGSENIPFPKSIVKTDWATNPNFRGAYTYTNTSLNKSQNQCFLDALKLPLPSGCSELPPILYFAGEHTCPGELLGTVKGAMISGVREAERVIAAIHQTAAETRPCESAVFC